MKVNSSVLLGSQVVIVIVGRPVVAPYRLGGSVDGVAVQAVVGAIGDPIRGEVPAEVPGTDKAVPEI